MVDERLAAAGREPQLGLLALAGAEHDAPHPGHEVAPVVEVEVRDDDGVEPRPPFGLPQAREHSGPAVEEDACAAGLDEVAGLGAARVRPGG